MKTFNNIQSIKLLMTVLLFVLSIFTFCQDIDTLQINNPPEIIANTNSQEEIETTAVDSRKSPLLYNRFIGSIMDETAFVIPLAFFFTRGYWEPHNNILVHMCVYPMGAVFIEKFIKNMFVHKPYFSREEPHLYFSMNGQVGVITPASAVSHANEGFYGPNMDAKVSAILALQFEYLLNKSFGIQVAVEGLGDAGYLTEENEYRFLGHSVGLRFIDWSINVNKINLGYSFKDNTSIVYNDDFWGFGVGWSKRIYLYKGIFIEPDITYRFSRTADYSVSIIGLFGGLDVGIKF